VEVEGLAHAAGEVVTLLPSSASPETRRTFARRYAWSLYRRRSGRGPVAQRATGLGAVGAHGRAKGDARAGPEPAVERRKRLGEARWRSPSGL
jgi:hypothetical protein